LLANINL